MFASLEFWLLALRAVVIVTVFAAFAWALVISRRDMLQSFNELAVRHDHALIELRRLTHRVEELGGAVGELGERLTRAATPAAAPTPVAPAPVPTRAAAPSGARGYDMAIRLARSGASVDEIVASCGTTRAEARLLRGLHCAGSAAA
jgi:hypothetical protein